MPDQAAINEMYRGWLRDTGKLNKNDVTNMLRYRSVLRHDVGLFMEADVLEVGCGTGEFFDFLMARQVRPKSYLGIDPLAEAIDLAVAKMKKHWPAVTSAFLHCPDYLASGRRTVDTVLFVGVFDVMLGDDSDVHDRTVRLMVEKAFRDARRAVCATFMGFGWRGDVRQRPAHAGPILQSDAFNIFKQHCDCVILDDSYAPHVYTVTGFKGETPWDRGQRGEPV